MQQHSSSNHISDLAVVFLAVTVITTALYPPRIGATGSLIPGISGVIVVFGWALFIITKRIAS